MNKHYEALELPKILEMLAGHTACADARAAALAITPQTDFYEAQRLLEETKTAHGLIAQFGAPSFGGLQNARGLEQLHANKAAEENLRLAKGYVGADGYDDHALHIAEHTRFLLSDEFGKCGGEAKERFERHLAEHESALGAKQNKIE